MTHRPRRTAYDLAQLEDAMRHTTEQNRLANLIIDERVRNARRTRSRKVRRDNPGIR
jgi:hypothetical protein